MYAKYDISNDVRSVETIAFLDLTGGKEFNLADVKLLPLKEVVEQIKLDTGREIKINNKTALESIGIVKYDLPLGYALFANKDIEKNQILFNYGGMRTNIKPVTNAYLLEIDDEDSLDAEHQGDLGSLCMHLFDPLQFEGYTEISIDEMQYNKIQFHNLYRELIPTNNTIDYQFRAREFIPQGSALGFTYGFSYWFIRGTSPLIMSKSGNPINGLSVSEPLFCLRSWESNTNMGSIVYRKEDLLHHFYRNQNKKLCVFWPEDPARPVAYTNKCIMKSLIETTSYSSVFVFITVKDIGQELVKALGKGKDKIELPLSIYANPGEAGPFSDCYVGENEVPEEHEIDNVYFGR